MTFWQKIWGWHWGYIRQFLFHALMCHSWSLTGKSWVFLSSGDLLSLVSKPVPDKFAYFLGCPVGHQIKGLVFSSSQVPSLPKIKEKIKWQFRSGSGRQESARLQELILRKWIPLRLPVYSSKISRNWYTPCSAPFQRAGERCLKPKKPRAGISLCVVVFTHKLSFHLGWDFFSQIISLTPVMWLLWQRTEVY